MSTEQIVFGLFRFDPSTLQLWKDEQAVAVQPKPLAVLRALATRPGQVVTKQALFKEVWAGTYMTQAVLRVAIHALREALVESADAPQYLETIGREGYRFLEEGVSRQEDERQKAKGKRQKAKGINQKAKNFPTQSFVFVGREAELAQLHKLLDKSLQGEPLLVFVTGEPGIGKTTLVEAFLQSLESRVQSLESENQKPLLSEVRTLDPRHQTLGTRP
jgi:DNA-binding winged helix-turn-helix (wHTH) protein